MWFELNCGIIWNHGKANRKQRGKPHFSTIESLNAKPLGASGRDRPLSNQKTLLREERIKKYFQTFLEIKIRLIVAGGIHAVVGFLVKHPLKDHPQLRHRVTLSQCGTGRPEASRPSREDHKARSLRLSISAIMRLIQFGKVFKWMQ